jgi:hypothetical protein
MVSTGPWGDTWALRSALASPHPSVAPSGLHLGGGELADLPDGAARHEQELDLQLLFGRALMAAKGYGAPELGETLARSKYSFLADQMVALED